MHPSEFHHITNVALFHYPQTRKDGYTPYFLHSVEVMCRLYKWGVKDKEMLIAALYHDVLEDTDVTYAELAQYINQPALDYVQSLTYTPTIETKQEYLERISKGCVRPLLIKIADRLCNVSDFYFACDPYARQYFKKAEIIFDAFGLRSDEIIRVFGPEVYESTDIDLSLIREIL